MNPKRHEILRWVAISATELQGVYGYDEFFSIFRGREPVAKIGYSIFIYDTDN
jgi:hypothetical protein